MAERIICQWEHRWLLSENQKKISDAYSNSEEYQHLIEHHLELEKVKMKISKALGMDVLK